MADEKSTKPSATAFILKSGQGKQSLKKTEVPVKSISKPAPKAHPAPVKKAPVAPVVKATTPVAEEKKKPVRLSDILKSKNEKNYSEFLSIEPKTRLKNIIVAQPHPEGIKSPYFDLESKYKVKFQFTPFVTVEGVPGKEFRKQRITLNDFSGIIFTSRNAIDHFFRICEELRVKMSQETKYFCTSEAIALYLQKYTQYRKRKVFFSDTNSNKEMRGLLLKHKDTTKCLYIGPEVRSKDEITSFMSEQNIPYAEAVMYKTVPSDLKKIDFKKFDMMILFSPSAVHSLYQSYPSFKQEKLKIGVYGKTTADAVLEAKWDINLMAPLEGSPSIIAALDNYLKVSNK
jgi:uroporphyrinogen-III synthase